jgi:hypothetical protein
MSVEDNFLDIYRVILEEDLDEFYAKEIESELEWNSGNIGRTMYRIVEEYDVPIGIDRESPTDASLFKVEEQMPYSDVEELLDTGEDKNQIDLMFKEAKNRLNGIYEDQELNLVLREVAENYYDNLGDRLQNMSRVKQRLQEEGEISGDTIDGWRASEQ